MAHYRIIDVRIWNDRKFRELSRDGKLAFLFMLTHPHLTALGAMRATVEGMAAEAALPQKAFEEAFRKALAKVDERASFVWLPRFLKYNQPQSPNVVKSWSRSLDLLPECDLKDELIQEVKAFVEGLPEAFGKALPKDFRKAFAKTSPNQEQEQEQEQLTPPLASLGAPPSGRAASRGKASRLPDDFELTDDRILIAVQEKLDPARTFSQFCDHWRAASGANARKHDWDATWRNWCRKQSDINSRQGNSNAKRPPRTFEEIQDNLRRLAIAAPAD